MHLTEPAVMRKVAYWLPAAVGVVVLAQFLWFGWSERFLASWVFLSLMSCYLAWFLHRRSHNREAAFFSTRIRPKDAEQRRYSVELVAMLEAPVLFALCLLLPWLRP